MMLLENPQVNVMKFMNFIYRKTKLHPAWLVLLCCCAFFGASMGIYNNCASLYTADMLAEMGWSLTLSTVLEISLTVSRLAATSVTYKVFRKYDLKLVLTLAVIAMMGGCIAKAFLKNMAHYVLINLLIGAGGAFLLYVPVPMLINNWFAKRKDTALGTAMLCSGLFAAICSPIFSDVMLKHGWRYANVVNGLTGLAVALPPIFLFAVKTPEQLGLKPYGWTEPEPMKVATSPSQVFENGNEDFDTRFSAREKKNRFLLSAVFSLLIFAISYLPARLPHFASTGSIGTAAGALMFSVSQIGNMASKGLMGPLNDRFGSRRTYTAALAVVLVSCILLCFMPTSLCVLLPVAFLTGVSSGNNMMIYPAAVRTYSRGEEYTYYISRVSMAMTFFGTPFSLLLGVLFDTTQNYRYTFLLFAGMAAVTVVLSLLMFRKDAEAQPSGTGRREA